MRLEGKTAVIIGASRNLGRAVALAFAREGAELNLVARESRAELEAVAAECRSCGVAAEPMLCDIADREAIDDMIHKALARFGKIDSLLCLAKIRPHKRITEVTYEEWRHVMATNLDSFFCLTKAVLPGMIERRSGSIVAVSQLYQSRWPATYQTHILAAKGGVLGMITGLAVELGEFGIRVNAVGLGRMDTERRNAEWYPEYAGGEILRPEDRIRQIPLKRPGKVEEVANAFVFLASEESSYITGACLNVNGGLF